MTEDQARAVLLLQSLEEAPASAAASASWSAEDRQWATRAAAQGLPTEAPRDAIVAERARLAAQRLVPRDAGLRRALSARLWHPAWPMAAGAAGVLLGMASDAWVGGAYFNLLSPLFWGLLAWNGLVYVAMAVQSIGGPGRWLQRLAASALLRRLRGHGVGTDFAARWALASGPLTMARAAALLHALAAGLALGLVAGLVLRGLVLDYRAGWATTLLAPETVRGVLTALFHPAWALTGQTPPDAADFMALRVVSGQPATASAAPWIVLMACQMLLWVVLPRTVMAVVAGRRAARLRGHFPLPVDGPAFDRWVASAARPAAVWVLPHGQTPDPAAVNGLRALLQGVWGDGVQLTVADALPWGDEEQPPPVPAGARAVLLVDLTATPEAEVHGRLLRALNSPPLVVADAHAFIARFGPGDRLAQRRDAWQALLGPVPFVAADLRQADLSPAVRAACAALAA